MKNSHTLVEMFIRKWTKILISKTSKMNKLSMVDTWVFVDFGCFWNWFIWSYSERYDTLMLTFYLYWAQTFGEEKSEYFSWDTFGKWSKLSISKTSEINKISCINHAQFLSFLMFLKSTFLIIFPMALQLIYVNVCPTKDYAWYK